MKNFRLLLLTGLLIFSGISVAHGQKDYNTALGVRMGLTAGLTVKQFVSQRSAFEGIISSRWHGFLITGLYEIHQNVFNNNRFNFYYGFGGHVGYWNVGRYDHPWYKNSGQYTAFGVDGILGLEYSFPGVPINLSLDWKPMLNLVNYTGFWGDDVGLSVRIYF
jgi:hypothetical protein